LYVSQIKKFFFLFDNEVQRAPSKFGTPRTYVRINFAPSLNRTARCVLYLFHKWNNLSLDTWMVSVIFGHVPCARKSHRL